MIAEAAGQRLVALPGGVVPAAASPRLLSTLGRLREIQDLVLEHRVGEGLVGYAYGVSPAQIPDGDLTSSLRKWIAEPELNGASPYVYLEYDADRADSAPPHVFFRVPCFDDRIVRDIEELLLEEEDAALRRRVRIGLERLRRRLPLESRSGFLGSVVRPRLRELRCQFPIAIREIRPLLQDVAQGIAHDLESILVGIERAGMGRVNLQLGIGEDGISTRVGVEFGVARWSPNAPAVWRRIANDLVASDVAVTFGRQLDDWWGSSDEPVAHVRWSHFKLATGDDDIELKHYLWLRSLGETNGVDDPKVLG